MISTSAYQTTFQKNFIRSKVCHLSQRLLFKKSETKILIVEDNIINQKIEVIFLNNFGYENIDIACSGEEAIEKCMNTNYSLILLDIGLPDINGFKVSQNIRRNTKNHLVPIIAISAYRQQDIEDKCYISGMNHVMSKPLFINDLKSVIEKFINRKN